MWTAHAQRLSPTTQKVCISSHRPLSRQEVVARWALDAQFREWFTQTLIDVPFDAYFWETPVLTQATLPLPFEYVAAQATALRQTVADASPFESQFFAQPQAEVLSFANLGGDAQLIVPAPRAAHACYAHLATFLRQAPPPQVDAFWQKLGAELSRHHFPHPVWVSTAGLGVSWLHLRIDTRPKYFRYEPYRAVR